MQAVIGLAIKVLDVLMLVVVVICLLKTTELFNKLPDGDKYKPVISWDMLIIFFMALYLIVRIVR